MRLGTVLENGSILLHDENINYRDAMSGKYQRIRQNVRQRDYLGSIGFQAVDSSFISGIMQSDDDLVIRFHNNSVYEYYGFAKHFDNMMKASSKGQYFNRMIRPTRYYKKIDDITFPANLKPSVLEITDDELFKALDIDYIKKLAFDLVGAELYAQEVFKNGIKYMEYRIDNMYIYRPLIQSQ